MCSCILLQSFLPDQPRVSKPSRWFIYSIPIEIDLLEFKMKSSSNYMFSFKSLRNAFFLERIWSKYFVISLEPLLVLIEYVPFGDLLGYLRKSRGLNDTYYNIKPDPDISGSLEMTYPTNKIIGNRCSYQMVGIKLYIETETIKSLHHCLLLRCQVCRKFTWTL